MTLESNEKVLAYLALFTGLAISAVAIYYSVSGLVSIFAAAAIPIIIMGVVLEVGKLVATLWLKQNWKIAPALIRGYLLIAVIILMFITSMGIFGFLSRAHIEQSLSSGDNTVMLAEIDRQIEIEQRKIEDSTKIINQLDQAVQSLTDAQRLRGRDGAIAVRRAQTAERAELNQSIAEANAAISTLQQQRLPLAKEQLNLEAEVGPIKYIAALIYGDNPDKDLLEKAVRWVIIIIVIIFDPLAVVLLLASQYSFQNIREKQAVLPVPVLDKSVVDDEPKVLPKDEVINHEVDIKEQEIQESTAETEKSILEQHPYLNEPFVHFQNLKPLVADTSNLDVKEEPQLEIKDTLKDPNDPKLEDSQGEKNYIVKEGDKQIKMVYVPSKK